MLVEIVTQEWQELVGTATTRVSAFLGVEDHRGEARINTIGKRRFRQSAEEDACCVLIRNVCPEYRRSALRSLEIRRSAQSFAPSSATCGRGNQSAQRRIVGIGHRLTIAIHWSELIIERAAALLEGKVCTAISGKITLRPA